MKNVRKICYEPVRQPKDEPYICTDVMDRKVYDKLLYHMYWPMDELMDMQVRWNIAWQVYINDRS